MGEGAQRRRREPGERAYRLIVLFKVGKAIIESGLALVLLVLLLTGSAERLRDLALAMEEQEVGAWSLALARALLAATSGRRLEIACLALALDGLVTAIEGYGLVRRRSWAPWLVVGVTSLLLPLEVLELAREVRPGRILVLVINVLVVAYFVRYARRAAIPAPSTSDRP